MNLFGWRKRRKREERPLLSVIIPFREGDSEERDRIFHKLKDYYERNLEEALPGTEVIIGRDPLDAYPYNKSASINEGVRRSRGRVIAVVDADCYIDFNRLIEAAEDIETSLFQGYPMWIMPYDRLYRLTERFTWVVMRNMYDRDFWGYDFLGDPPPWRDWEHARSPSSASDFGALVQVMPREAFDLVEGWDTRFQGWGSEDLCMLRALDTLYCMHSNLKGPVYHLWHPSIPGDVYLNRLWEGQESSRSNWWLSAEYRDACGNIKAMEEIVDQSLEFQIERELLQTVEQGENDE